MRRHRAHCEVIVMVKWVLTVHTVWLLSIATRAPSLYKDRLFWYRDSQYKDETVVRPSHLYNGNLDTSKTASLY